MKRTLIIGSVAFLIFLIVRMIYIQSGKDDDARREFVTKLDYHFGARVDSVGLFNKHEPMGFIYLSVKGDTINNRERKITRGSENKYRFLVPKGNRFEIFSRDARKFKAGDSVYVNSAENNMRLFRSDSIVDNFSISETVRR